LIQVIKTVTLVGNGTPTNAYREVTQYWHLDGKLIYTSDPPPNGNIQWSSPVKETP
jgi:hypothetical protein